MFQRQAGALWTGLAKELPPAPGHRGKGCDFELPARAGAVFLVVQLPALNVRGIGEVQIAQRAREELVA